MSDDEMGVMGKASAKMLDDIRKILEEEEYDPRYPPPVTRQEPDTAWQTGSQAAMDEFIPGMRPMYAAADALINDRKYSDSRILTDDILERGYASNPRAAETGKWAARLASLLGPGVAARLGMGAKAMVPKVVDTVAGAVQGAQGKGVFGNDIDGERGAVIGGATGLLGGQALGTIGKVPGKKDEILRALQRLLGDPVGGQASQVVRRFEKM